MYGGRTIADVPQIVYDPCSGLVLFRFYRIFIAFFNFICCCCCFFLLSDVMCFDFAKRKKCLFASLLLLFCCWFFVLLFIQLLFILAQHKNILYRKVWYWWCLFLGWHLCPGNFFTGTDYDWNDNNWYSFFCCYTSIRNNSVP